MGNAIKQFTKEIDSKLETVATKMRGEVLKDRPGYPEGLRKFEERRVDWIEDSISKSILFQPYFGTDRVNEEKWSFKIVAWYCVGTTDLRFFEALATKEDFHTIANQLDQLLILALERLGKIDMRELEKLNQDRLKTINSRTQQT